MDTTALGGVGFSYGAIQNESFFLLDMVLSSVIHLATAPQARGEIRTKRVDLAVALGNSVIEKFSIDRNYSYVVADGFNDELTRKLTLGTRSDA
jgi:hypothetical protein